MEKCKRQRIVTRRVSEEIRISALMERPFDERPHVFRIALTDASLDIPEIPCMAQGF